MAYTFSPSEWNWRHEWQIFINDKFDRSYENLRAVLVHEIGHALGVKHIEDKKCVMYFQNSRTNEIILSKTWADQLKTLYSKYCK
jgi:predicted Zn-dependent protease